MLSPLVGRIAAPALLAVALGCSPLPEDEADASGAATSRGDRSLAELDVVAVAHDQATADWIAAQRSTVDGAVVGTDPFRQREIFVRLQRAINARVLAPAAVYFGNGFVEATAHEEITTALAEAMEASPVPVVVAPYAGAGWMDKRIYHGWALTDPPNVLLCSALDVWCTEGACSSLHVTTTPNTFGSAPACLRAAGALAVSSEKMSLRLKRKAVDDAADLLPRDKLLVPTAPIRARRISLKQLLTDPEAARAIAGAAIVVSRNGQDTVSLGGPAGEAAAALDDLDLKASAWLASLRHVYSSGE